MRDDLIKMKDTINSTLIQFIGIDNPLVFSIMVVEINDIIDEYITRYTESPNDIKKQSKEFGYYN